MSPVRSCTSLLGVLLLAPVLGAQQADSAPASRALASPLDSPPFPNSDWLGGPVIGEPDGTPDYPMQRAIFGNSLDASRFKIYGWVDLSANASTSNNSNSPLTPTIVPNKFELEQLVLRIDRTPNTVQTDHADWGFHFTGMYGIDYRYSTAKGWLSDQLLQHNELVRLRPHRAVRGAVPPARRAGHRVQDRTLHLARRHRRSIRERQLSAHPSARDLRGSRHVHGRRGDRPAEPAVGAHARRRCRQRHGSVAELGAAQRPGVGAMGVAQRERRSLGRREFPRQRRISPTGTTICSR